MTSILDLRSSLIRSLFLAAIASVIGHYAQLWEATSVFYKEENCLFFYKLETIASFGDAKVANIGDGGI
ncbi:MAG: hypothetical protein AAFP20_24780 [Cyanobacteria bacterium J06614_10]